MSFTQWQSSGACYHNNDSLSFATFLHTSSLSTFPQTLKGKDYLEMRKMKLGEIKFKYSVGVTIQFFTKLYAFGYFSTNSLVPSRYQVLFWAPKIEEWVFKNSVFIFLWNLKFSCIKLIPPWLHICNVILPPGLSLFIYFFPRGLKKWPSGERYVEIVPLGWHKVSDCS